MAHTGQFVGPNRMLRRASYNNLTFMNPELQSLQHIPRPPRPASSFNRESLPRPLSNIHEAPESILGDVSNSFRLRQEIPSFDGAGHTEDLPHVQRYTLNSHGLPLSSVPERKSSRNVLRRKSSLASRISATFASQPPLEDSGQTIPRRGPSMSPVRVAAARLDPISSEIPKVPSRTFIRPLKPTNILTVPSLKHHRVVLDTRLSAPIFVGGGTVEGQVQITVDGGPSRGSHKSRPPLSIGRISVDVLGVESFHGKHWIFQSLANELIDEKHAPPNAMIDASRAPSDAFWSTVPSYATLPFRMNLPVNMGPPSYQSKHARIRYILCITLAIRSSDKQRYVRQSREIQVLSVLDPETALVSLPSPLTAYDEILLQHGTVQQAIKLTAGLHRQTWVSGTTLFVDVHVSNDSSKNLKKLVVQLEKVTLFHDHAATTANTGSADHLRLPDGIEKKIVLKSIIKGPREWQGVQPHSHEIKTCKLDLPRGLATIETVHPLIAERKQLNAQLPVTIIHPNSLDIVPNSLAQVAAAIQTEFDHRILSGKQNLKPYGQGQAYAAARKQSALQLNKTIISDDELDELRRQVDGSPRKPQRRSRNGAASQRTVSHASAGLTGEDSSLPVDRYRYPYMDAQGSKLQRSVHNVVFDEPDSTEEHLHSAVGVDVFQKPTRNFHVTSEGKIQRELSVARRTSKDLKYQGWRNIALEAATRAGIKEISRV